MQPLTKTHTPLSGTLFMDNVIWLALSRAIRWLWSLLHLDLRRGKFVASFWRSSALATFTSFSCVWGRTISNLTLVTQKHFNEPPVEDRVPCVFCFYYRSCQAAISAGKCKFFLSDRRTSCIFMAEIKTVMHLRAKIPLHSWLLTESAVKQKYVKHTFTQHRNALCQECDEKPIKGLLTLD